MTMRFGFIGILLSGVALLICGAFLTLRAVLSDDNLNVTGIIIMTGGGIISLVAFFLRSRIKDGVGLFEITGKDKKEIQDLKRELNPWRIINGLLLRIGGLLVLAGAASIVRGLIAGPTMRTHWCISLLIIGLGVMCLLPTVLSQRRK